MAFEGRNRHIPEEGAAIHLTVRDGHRQGKSGLVPILLPPLFVVLPHADDSAADQPQDQRKARRLPPIRQRIPIGQNFVHAFLTRRCIVFVQSLALCGRFQSPLSESGQPSLRGFQVPWERCTNGIQEADGSIPFSSTRITDPFRTQSGKGLFGCGVLLSMLMRRRDRPGARKLGRRRRVLRFLDDP